MGCPLLRFWAFVGHFLPLGGSGGTGNRPPAPNGPPQALRSFALLVNCGPFGLSSRILPFGNDSSSSDASAQRIRKVSNGIITVAGSGARGFGGDRGPAAKRAACSTSRRLCEMDSLRPSVLDAHPAGSTDFLPVIPSSPARIPRYSLLLHWIASPPFLVPSAQVNPTKCFFDLLRAVSAPNPKVIYIRA